MNAAINANTRQIAEWNGPAGNSWRSHQARFDRMLKPFSDALLAAADIRPGEQVLEIGCGAGSLALDLAGRGAKVVAVDVSQGLLDLARTRAPAVDFRLGDASHMAFGPDFDLLISHLGVMFFDDPAAAFANLRMALNSKGRLAMLTWRSAAENEVVTVCEAALAPNLVAPVRPPDAPGPFSFGDRDRVHGILAKAGFTDIAIVPFDSAMLFGEGETGDLALDDALVMAQHIGPLRRWLDGVEGATADVILERLRVLFIDHLTSRGVELKGAAWVITATV